MAPTDVAHAIEWLAGNAEWSAYIAEHGPDSVAQAYPHLTPDERHTVWVAVRQRLGLTVAEPQHQRHLPETLSHRENVPIKPDDGPLPGADGTPTVYGVGLDGTFGPHGVHVSGANVQGIAEDALHVPGHRHAYVDPTTDTDPGAAVGHMIDQVIQHAVHPSQDQIHAQWEALQAFGHTVTELGRVAVSGQPTDVQPAIVLCLVAARDLLRTGNELQAETEVTHALNEWDIRCHDPHAATHQHWLQAAETVHAAAEQAHHAWQNWCSSVYGLLGSDQSNSWHASRLAEAAVHAHQAIGSAAQL